MKPEANPDLSITVDIKAGSIDRDNSDDVMIKALIVDPTAIDTPATKSLPTDNVDTFVASDILILNVDHQVN